ncbi:hypothetical protein [Rhodoferax fermentans]|uniref:Peptidase inhibitor I78 family protein n=1 Tax=Rhodoferax fermentans TaxID=28066 RepID=A0A1T1AT13_RHOFE|nr:hypothetical protein [Rhodoferax fermentans]MBK1682315.1 hypothetical protein [Rhodoferax fermentans]OOV07236.1 hypothetical protein RF819_11295 [Rhodoferax fermentans]
MKTMSCLFACCLCLAASAQGVAGAPQILHPGDPTQEGACQSVALTIVGQSFAHAEQLAKQHQLLLRRYRQDQHSYPGTMDVRPDRLNVDLQKGRVFAARCG